MASLGVILLARSAGDIMTDHPTVLEPTVPLLDLKAQYATIRDEIEPVVKKVIEDQWFILGPEVKGLEEEIAAYTGATHAVGCSSGSDAILLALMALGIGCNKGHNDKVLCLPTRSLQPLAPPSASGPPRSSLTSTRPPTTWISTTPGG